MHWLYLLAFFLHHHGVMRHCAGLAPVHGVPGSGGLRCWPMGR